MTLSIMEAKVLKLHNHDSITLSLSNTKLGRMPNFSLVCGVTCPGQTVACAEVCYAEKYGKCFPSTMVAYSKNLDLTLMDDNWAMPIIKHLARMAPAYFRIHVSGDFYRPKYIQDWGKIIAMFPSTRFLAFTRSWRIPRLRKELNALRKLPNVQIIASLDDEAHNAPEGWRLAYMGEPAERPRGFIKCLNFGPAKLKCDACGVCFKPLKANIWFPLH